MEVAYVTVNVAAEVVRKAYVPNKQWTKNGQLT